MLSDDGGRRVGGTGCASIEVNLASHDIPFAWVNPRQARRFAEGTGTLAKTDRVDAAMLARMGALLELKADKPKNEMLYNLKGMEAARQALITNAPKK